MTGDPRTTLANGRVAHDSLRGQVEAARFVPGDWAMVQQPMANICDAPRGGRISQMVYGERFLVLEVVEGHAFGQAERDGYVGHVLANTLCDPTPPTHWVAAPATHLYPQTSIKAPPEVSIFFGSRLRIVAEVEGFAQTHTGHFVPRAHLQPVKARYGDPVGVADMFLGTPYLWGGISRWGLDCSGLVQTALLACGIPCPRDSDQQEAALGTALDPEAPLARGDLVFWKGHVGMMANDRMLLHANAHHMAVAYEPLTAAVARITASGGGAITACKRLARAG